MTDIDSRFMVLSAVDRGTPLADILAAVDLPPRSVRAVLNSLAADGSLRVSSNLYTITDKGIETRLALQHLIQKENEQADKIERQRAEDKRARRIDRFLEVFFQVLSILATVVAAEYVQPLHKLFSFISSFFT